MWKRVWEGLDAILSFVGLLAVIVVGVRYVRGFPPLPTHLFSDPVAVKVAPGKAPSAAPGAANAAAPAVSAAPQATLMPIVPLEEGTGSDAKVAAPEGATPPLGKSPYKQAHKWRQEVAVTVNSSRYVKSLSDLVPSPASLPEAVRRQFKEAQAQAAGSEMLLLCNVTIEYSGSEEVTLDQSGFRMISPEHQVYRAVPIPFSTRDLQPLRATLLANGSAKGDLVFAVKRGVQLEDVLYDPES